MNNCEIKLRFHYLATSCSSVLCSSVPMFDKLNTALHFFNAPVRKQTSVPFLSVHQSIHNIKRVCTLVKHVFKIIKGGECKLGT